VLVAPGSDARLGMGDGTPDRILAPTALKYATGQEWLTGGEALAYMIHHWTRQHMVMRIPDLWMVGLAVLLGKAIAVLVTQRSQRWNTMTRLQVSAALVGGVAIYSLVVLQIYISALMLLPWFLPSSVFLTYSLSAIKRRNYA
jgi:hypothetical protein